MQFTSFAVQTWDQSVIEFRRQPINSNETMTYVALYLTHPVNRGLLFTVGNPMTSDHDSDQWREKLEKIAVMVFGKRRDGKLNAEKGDVRGLDETIKKLMW
jgi:hypothetical protein